MSTPTEGDRLAQIRERASATFYEPVESLMADLWTLLDQIDLWKGHAGNLERAKKMWFTKERERTEERDDARHAAKTLREKLEAQGARVRMLTGTLEFYARCTHSRYVFDAGRQARAALAYPDAPPRTEEEADARTLASLGPREAWADQPRTRPGFVGRDRRPTPTRLVDPDAPPRPQTLDDLTLPTREQVEAAVREGERRIAEGIEELRRQERVARPPRQKES